jgi:hypothetical protein
VIAEAEVQATFIKRLSEGLKAQTYAMVYPVLIRKIYNPFVPGLIQPPRMRVQTNRVSGTFDFSY